MRVIGESFGRIPEEINIPTYPFSRWSLIHVMIPKIIAYGRKTMKTSKDIPQFIKDTPDWCVRMTEEVKKAKTKEELLLLWKKHIELQNNRAWWGLLVGGSKAGLDLTPVNKKLTEMLGSEDASTLLSNLRGDSDLQSLGPSGSGKSTLMNIIGGVDEADSGEVFVDEIEVNKLSDVELTEYGREDIGFIFQFYNLVPNLTEGENIEVVSNISKNPIDIDEVLIAVGMQDKKHRFPRELSGGEQQRVSIARAIIKNPKLLLCDEPTGALDYLTSRSILKLLQQVNKRYGTTILMITHNEAIAAMANRVFKVRSGEIVEASVNQTTIPAERIEW
jgi:putative ABC transport system ATP-binding protein